MKTFLYIVYLSAILYGIFYFYRKRRFMSSASKKYESSLAKIDESIYAMNEIHKDIRHLSNKVLISIKDNE